MDNYQQNQDMEYTQKFDLNSNFSTEPPRKSNTGLIIAISILSCFLVFILVFGTLFLTGVLSFDGSSKRVIVENGATEDFSKPIPVNKNMYIDCDFSVTLRTGPSTSASEIRQISNGTSVYVIEYTNETFAKVNHNGQTGYVMNDYLSETQTIIPVNKTMFVDCNVSLTLRNGPATSYSSIYSISVGDAVYVIEYTNSEFAKVTHNGTTGYVMSKYLSDTQPYVWDYNAYEVQNFVSNSLYAFVNGVNNNDASYVYDYYTGSAVNEEIKSCNSISANVISEEILQVNCHSVTRVSPTRVTVVRDSIIRVVYNDGSIKDITEKYKYTVDYSQGRMYIVSLERM